MEGGDLGQGKRARAACGGYICFENEAGFAEQLLACASHDMPVQRLAPDGSALPAETLLEQWDHESLTHS
ncbi:hypothetical protein QF037_009473 [Streptomyces canus]|nr:hypothetical protein [Streptomyces canus]